VHTPPHPSLAPHPLPLQFGVQPHTLEAPPPPQVKGDVQGLLPAQHACPLPPHVPQLPVPHATPAWHAVQAVPPFPHEPSLAPAWHVLPWQHPVHDVGSHTQTASTQ